MPPPAWTAASSVRDLRVVGDVRGNGDGAGFRRERREAFGAAGNGEDRPAGGAQGAHRGLADSGGGAGDYCCMRIGCM